MSTFKKLFILLWFFIVVLFSNASAFAAEEVKEYCVTINGKSVPVATLITNTDVNGIIKATLIVSKNLNDNTYGSNTIGWGTKSHTLSNLTGSDKANFVFTDKNGNKVLDFDLDYISSSSKFTSGYGTLGVSGGDGRITSGNPVYIKSYNTSLSRNFNEFNYVLTTNSPATDNNYTPNTTYPNWIFDIIYEVTIDKAAFGTAGFGSVSVPTSHHSPNKLGLDNAVKGTECLSVGCDLRAFITYTQGGWGGPKNSTPGKLRYDYFKTVFPSGMTVGGTYKITLTKENNVEDYLPDGGTAAKLTQNYVNPKIQISVLAGQVTALKLNVYFDAAGYLSFSSTDLGDLYIVKGPFTGMKVNQFLAFAEQALGGGNLNGFTYVQISDAATAINENFDNGTVDKGYLACETQPCYSSIGDFVWHDKDVDGIQDANEPGIAGVVVELLQNSTIISTKTTDASGKYEFTNLTNGTYEVRIAASNYTTGVLKSTAQTKWYSTKKDQGSDDAKDSDAINSETVTVVLNCNNNLTIDFGFYKTCVSLIKTADKQTAKPGDVITYTFTVENCGDVSLVSGVAVYDRMFNTTSPYNIWSYSPVIPGEIKTFTKTYTVKTTDCGELVNTAKAVGQPADGSAAVEFTATAKVTIICKSSLGDKVWEDLDRDGIQDQNEPGMENITVKLFDCLNALKSTTTTDNNGNYLFSDLEPGDYSVKFEKPAGYVFTTKDAGSDDAVDSDADLTTGKTICTTLTAGENDLTWDAGLYKECKNTIGDFVWRDKNWNGIQDANELGIEGVVVELLNSSGGLIAKDTTDASGKYEFTNLLNGIYGVRVAASNYTTGVLKSTPQTKWYSTKKNQGDDIKDSDADKDETVTVKLDCNNDLTIDFGFYKTCVSVIKTADKQSAMPGEKIKYTFTVENCGDITLSGGVDFYDALLNPTAPHWIKNISSVAPGQIKSFDSAYTVKATDCGELVNTVKAVGHPSNGTADVEFTATAKVTIICKASIGDKVWEDLDKDGIQDLGEPGIKDVVVNLYDCTDNLKSTTTTDNNGKYLFSNLDAGDYYVQFVKPAGYVFTIKDAGSNDAVDSDANLTTGKTVCTTLIAGENDLTWDAGLYKECKNTIGDFVWHDKNWNGIQDSGEPGIAGVVVELLNSTGVLIAKDTTDASGKYEFTNLLNGTYRVKVAASNYNTGGVLYSTSQTKWYSTKKNQGTDDAKDSDANKGETVTVTLNCNNDLTIDFGYYKTCVSVIKTADKQVYKPGDIITYTFTVENCGDITLSGGVDFYDALLNPSGNNWIKNITPVNPGEIKTFTKTYTVKSTDCGELLNIVKAIGHPLNSTADVEFIDSVAVTIDCAQCLNKIGDFVWHDKNANGIQDTCEPGIPGVVVQLIKGMNITSTTTDVNGKYEFTNLADGAYGVRVAASNYNVGGVLYSTAQTKWYSTKKDQGGDDAKDSDANKGETVSVTLNCNNDLTIDFGFYKACVSIIKTADKETYKPDEIIKYHFVVENCGDVKFGSGAIVYDQMFGGKIAQFDLEPGAKYEFDKEYTVTLNDCDKEIKNTARVEGHPIDSSEPVVDESSVTVKVECPQPCKNTIGDFVWHDKNVNGIQDVCEPGIKGVVVELYDNNNIFLKSTITDNNGLYQFTNLNDGTYKVKVGSTNFDVGGVLFNTAKIKWYATLKDAGSDDTKDSDANKNKTVTVILSCNNDLTIDFGFYKLCVSLIKTANKQSAKPGDVIKYHFVVENCGDVKLGSGVIVYDQMFGGKIAQVDLEAGAKYEFDKEYTVTTNDCGNLINKAIAEGHPVDSSEPVIDESSVTVLIICDEKADVRIEKTVSNENPQCNDNVTFTIKVTNDGPNTATGIKVSDILPSGLVYQSSSATQGSFNSSTGVWTVGSLTSGSFAKLTITVKVDCDNLNNSVFDLGAAKDYNLFALEDVNQPSSDTQGKMAVGRNATLANYSVGDQLPANSGDVLVVGNNLTFTSGAIYSGNVVYGNSTNLPVYSVSIIGGTLRKDYPINFAAAKIHLENLSTSLAAKTVNGTVNFQWGGLYLTGSDPYLNVFKVEGSKLSIANNFDISVPNGSVVLVNIDGTNVSWMGGLTVNGTSINNVLYNFYQATSMTIHGIEVRGSILAPRAAVNFPAGNQKGQMICKSLEGRGQFNLAQFHGNIPCEKQVTNVACISEVITNDPNLTNNSSSATITVNTASNNGGGTNGNWQYIGGFAAGEIVYTMAYSNGAIYAGTWGGKIYRSTNNGQNWLRINGDMNVGFIWSLKIKGSWVFAATEKGVYRYNGSAWTLIGLINLDVHALAVSGNVLYAGAWGSGVYMSTNDGTSWTSISNGLGYNLAIQSLAVNSSSELFVATLSGGVFKYTGSTWVKMNVGYDVVWALGSTPTGLFVGTYGDGLYRSLNGGSTWAKITNLEAPYIYSIAVDASNRIYVASWTSGVFVSNDNGNTWTSLGMGGLGVSTVMVNPNTNDVFAGTKEGKIFLSKSTNGTTSVGDPEAVPTKFELSQNYPNPFNPSTTIRVVIPEAGKYTVKVYNVLGQEVATLANGEMRSGIHKVTFNANNLASGMYIYMLTGNNVNISKKMILMK